MARNTMPVLVDGPNGEPIVEDRVRTWLPWLMRPEEYAKLEELAAHEQLSVREKLERVMSHGLNPQLAEWPKRKAELQAQGKLNTRKIATKASTTAGLSDAERAAKLEKQRQAEEAKAAREKTRATRAQALDQAREERRVKLEAEAQRIREERQQRAAKAKAEAENAARLRQQATQQTAQVGR